MDILILSLRAIARWGAIALFLSFPDAGNSTAVKIEKTDQLFKMPKNLNYSGQDRQIDEPVSDDKLWEFLDNASHAQVKNYAARQHQQAARYKLWCDRSQRDRRQAENRAAVYFYSLLALIVVAFVLVFLNV